MNETHEKTIKIINENVDNAGITLEQANGDLTQLGMDSITFIRIIVALEEEFDIEIPDEYLLMTEMNTISKMVGVISAALDIKEQE